MYAEHSEFFSSDPIIGGSETSAIRALSFLSILTNILLAATIHAAFEKLTHWLVARYGLNYFRYLALQVNTAVSGRLKIILWRDGRRVMARVWSALRLTAMVVPPLLNFLIMSKRIFSLDCALVAYLENFMRFECH
jgi:hypothetical protein